MVAADAQQYWLLLNCGARFIENFSDVNSPFVAAERNERQREGVPANCLSGTRVLAGFSVVANEVRIPEGQDNCGACFATFWMILKGGRRPGSRPRFTSANKCYYPPDNG